MRKDWISDMRSTADSSWMIDAAGQAQLILDEACIHGYVETGDKSLSKSIGILIG
jgi:hypothetical protein